MSNPRVKRPFAGNAVDPSQRQITSFFSPRNTSDVEAAAVTGPLRGPVLPNTVQSNLISVGMRVRKAVPEGYKTDGHSAFKLWTDNGVVTGKPTKTSASKAAASRELLPFCGINKVGGMDCQAPARRDFDDEDEENELPGLDEIPGLTMSQESTDSTSSRKRSLGEEDDDDFEPSRNLAPMGWGVGNARPMAIPRPRASRKASLRGTGGDQENMAVDDDFDDAEFLVYADGKEMDMTG